MKRRNSIYLLFLLMPFLAGCPYEASEPVGVKLPGTVQDLIGTWTNNHSRHNSQAIISAINENEYHIRFYKQTRQSVVITEFAGHLSKIGDVYFANIREMGEKYTKGGYLLFKIEMNRPGTVKIQAVDRYAIPNDLAGKDISNFLQENLANKEIFRSHEVWIKQP